MTTPLVIIIIVIINAIDIIMVCGLEMHARLEVRVAFTVAQFWVLRLSPCRPSLASKLVHEFRTISLTLCRLVKGGSK